MEIFPAKDQNLPKSSWGQLEHQPDSLLVGVMSIEHAVQWRNVGCCKRCEGVTVHLLTSRFYCVFFAFLKRSVERPLRWKELPDSTRRPRRSEDQTFVPSRQRRLVQPRHLLFRSNDVQWRRSLDDESLRLRPFMDPF